MGRKRHTPEQIITALREAEVGQRRARLWPPPLPPGDYQGAQEPHRTGVLTW